MVEGHIYEEKYQISARLGRPQGGIKFKLYLTTELTLFIFFFTQGGPVSEFSNEPSPYPSLKTENTTQSYQLADFDIIVDICGSESI